MTTEPGDTIITRGKLGGSDKKPGHYFSSEPSVASEPMTVELTLPEGAQRMALTADLVGRRGAAGWADLILKLTTRRGKIQEYHLNAATPTAAINSYINGSVTIELEPAVNGPVLDRLLTRLQSTTSVRTPAVDESRLDAKNEWIAQIEALIIQSVREGWTFEEVAQRAGFSERHLRDRFEQQMGLSLRDYRSNYQLHSAISLMRDSTRSLSDVAELCGFNSQSVFTRFIRRMADRTPRELCRQIREGRYVPVSVTEETRG